MCPCRTTVKIGKFEAPDEDVANRKGVSMELDKNEGHCAEVVLAIPALSAQNKVTRQLDVRHFLSLVFEIDDTKNRVYRYWRC